MRPGISPEFLLENRGVALDFWQNKKEESDRQAIVGYEEAAGEIIDLMRAKTLKDKMRIFDDVLSGDEGEGDVFGSLNEILSLWESVLRDAILIKHGCPELVANVKFSGEIKKIADRFEAGFFPKLYREIRLAVKYFGNNFNPRLVLENLLLTF